MGLYPKLMYKISTAKIASFRELEKKYDILLLKLIKKKALDI